MIKNEMHHPFDVQVKLNGKESLLQSKAPAAGPEGAARERLQALPGSDTAQGALVTVLAAGELEHNVNILNRVPRPRSEQVPKDPSRTAGAQRTRKHVSV